MLQLVYVSHASSPLVAADIDSLCKQAADNNKPLEITGVLAVLNEHFIQVLEGPKLHVEDTFMKIIVDHRHYGLSILSRRMITGREFGQWDMACCDGPVLLKTVTDRIDVFMENASASARKAWREVAPFPLSS